LTFFFCTLPMVLRIWRVALALAAEVAFCATVFGPFAFGTGIAEHRIGLLPVQRDDEVAEQLVQGLGRSLRLMSRQHSATATTPAATATRANGAATSGGTKPAG
jgi:hypothetical protein